MRCLLLVLALATAAAAQPTPDRAHTARETIALAEAARERGALLDAWRGYVEALAHADAAGAEALAQECLVGLLRVAVRIEDRPEHVEAFLSHVSPEEFGRVTGRAVEVVAGELGPEAEFVFHLRRFRAAYLYASHYARGEAEQALAAAREGLALAESHAGAESEEAATMHRQAANALRLTGRTDEALAALHRARRIREGLFGPTSLEVAETWRDEGLALAEAGRLVAARAALEQALALAESVAGAPPAAVAPYRQAVADLLRTLGDADRASAFAGPPEDAPDAEDATSRLTRLSAEAARREAANDLAGARRLHEEALGIAEASLGAAHPLTVALRARFLNLLIALDDAAAAARLAPEVLAQTEAAFGPESAETGLVLRQLSDVHVMRNEPEAAERALRRAVALFERHPGDVPRRAGALSALAYVLHIQRRHDEAGRHALAGALLLDDYLREVFPALSLAEQQAFLTTTLTNTGHLLLLSSYTTPAFVPDGYAVLGGWKGLLLRGVEHQSALARLADDPAHEGTVAELAAARQALAAATAAGDPERLRVAAAAKEALERRLAAALPPVPDAWDAHGVEGLRRLLPEGGAFVDLHRHGPDGAARYSAIVVAPEVPLRFVDLGPAEPLDAAVAAWRDEVTRGRLAFDGFDAIVRRAWVPVAAALPKNVEALWISPDGPLARMPWATVAAFDPRSADAVATQVPSPRALLALLDDRPRLSGDVLLVGGVDFGASGGWDALPGTEREVAAIADEAESLGIPTRLLRGAEASPAALVDALRGAVVAHIATHGFFFGESGGPSGSRGVVRRVQADEPASASRHPLTESGLALAGANEDPSGHLTAEEILGLDLRGLQLVVLSACDTGRGSEVTGQGVLGLQASLLAAGARGLLMSLWKVPDESTALLMERFYAYYFEGDPPAVALRRAQSDVMDVPDFHNPVHWAAWVVVGEGF